MTEEVQPTETFDFEFAYVADGVVKSVIHANSHIAEILRSPTLQVVETTAYPDNVRVGFHYDGNSFIMPEDFVMPGDPSPVDETIVPAEDPNL